ncbi:MAG: phosphate acyltransferase PlsX [Xanthomonadales bacterium]|nr:phosphate acyltransferase PlsX [Xanthomonadales bacterium]
MGAAADLPGARMVRMIQSETTVLALDAHGGDQGVSLSVPAALDALAQEPNLEIILVGDADGLKRTLESAGASDHPRLRIHHADSVIPMDAKAAAILRHGQNSSLWKAFELVAEKEAAACVSGGNTVAMMITGVKVIGMLPGLQRPALMAHVPNVHGFTGLLDVGANLNVSARQLVRFAVMGAVTVELADGIGKPRVGLLNVGHEDSKGHEIVQAAHQALSGLALNYTGFIEGHDIFDGTVDIAVCDGFAGNLILKSTEGLARMLRTQFREAFSASLASRAGAVLASASLRRMLAHLDPSAHNGAPLLGLKGVAVKSHGGANRKGMTRAILEAGREARRQVPGRIEASIHAYRLETGS